MTEGFVRVSHAALDALLGDMPAMCVYVELCRLAQYGGPVTRTTNRGVVRLEVGQCYVGRDSLGQRLKCTAKVARGALSRLEKVGVISCKGSNKGTVVTVLFLAEKLEQPTSKGPAKGQQRASSGPRTGHYQDQDLDRDRSFDRSDPEHPDRDLRVGGDRDQGHRGVRRHPPRSRPGSTESEAVVMREPPADLCKPGDELAALRMLNDPRALDAMIAARRGGAA